MKLAETNSLKWLISLGVAMLMEPMAKAAQETPAHRNLRGRCECSSEFSAYSVKWVVRNLETGAKNTSTWSLANRNWSGHNARENCVEFKNLHPLCRYRHRGAFAFGIGCGHPYFSSSYGVTEYTINQEDLTVKKELVGERLCSGNYALESCLRELEDFE